MKVESLSVCGSTRHESKIPSNDNQDFAYNRDSMQQKSQQGISRGSVMRGQNMTRQSRMSGSRYNRNIEYNQFRRYRGGSVPYNNAAWTRRPVYRTPLFNSGYDRTARWNNNYRYSIRPLERDIMYDDFFRGKPFQNVRNNSIGRQTRSSDMMPNRREIDKDFDFEYNNAELENMMAGLDIVQEHHNVSCEEHADNGTNTSQQSSSTPKEPSYVKEEFFDNLSRPKESSQSPGQNSGSFNRSGSSTIGARRNRETFGESGFTRYGANYFPRFNNQYCRNFGN
jgi:hypothetical protein